jgi:hypothetical protein
MLKTILSLTGVVVLGLQPAAAINANAGTTGFNFLKVGVGARAAALGGANTTLNGDLESTAANPASLWGLDQRTAALSLTSYLIDTQAGFLSIAGPRGNRVWGFSVNYFAYGSLDHTDADGQALGSFEPFDVATYVTVAQKMWNDRLIVGANLKAVYSTIGDFTSDAYMADLGIIIPGPAQGMRLGASISNLGSVRSGFKNFKDSLPVLVRLGISHQPAHTPLPIRLLIDLNVPNDNDTYLSFGAEIKLSNGLYIRPGYSTQQTGLQGDAPLGVSGGAGLELKRYRFDYAFTSFPDIGDVHRVSLSGGF